jgi:indole-3-glycerol phosphate synthase
VISELPKDVTIVSESGISTPADIEQVRQAGARAVLVGEHFMRQQDVKSAVLSLVGEARVDTPGVSL